MTSPTIWGLTGANCCEEAPPPDCSWCSGVTPQALRVDLPVLGNLGCGNCSGIGGKSYILVWSAQEFGWCYWRYYFTDPACNYYLLQARLNGGILNVILDDNDPPSYGKNIFWYKASMPGDCASWSGISIPWLSGNSVECTTNDPVLVTAL